MKNFVFLVLMSLIFAVCYAAPPPDPVPVPSSEVCIVSPDVTAMLAESPLITYRDVQPAPLLMVATLQYDCYSGIEISGMKDELNHCRLARSITLCEENTNRQCSFLYNDIGNYPLTHTSGGLPF